MEIKTTIPQAIKQYLKDGQWHWGGTISENVGRRLQHKASNVERRLREGVEDGYLEVMLDQVDGKGPKVTKYRLIKEGQTGLF